MKRQLLQLALLVFALSASSWAGDQASLSGKVVDANGVPQMGAVVELLNTDGSVLASVFTDRDGHYLVESAVSGIFSVRVTAAMFLPAVRSSVELHLATQTVANFTLNTLSEAMEWLPAKPRLATEPPDDWKWTLRAAPMRPILRFGGDDPMSGLTETAHRNGHGVRAHLAVVEDTSPFADAGVHQVFGVEGGGNQDSQYMVRGNLAPENTSSGSATVGYLNEIRPGQTFRAAGSYQIHQDVVDGPGASLAASSLRFASTSDFGTGLASEVGNEVQTVSWGRTITMVHPFARVNLHTGDSSSFTYAVSTSPSFGSSADVDNTRIDSSPLVSATASALQVEHGLHQGVGWSQQTPTHTLRILAFRDRVEDPVLSGSSTLSALDSAGLSLGYDSLTEFFRLAGPGYNTNGVEINASHTLGIVTAEIWLIDANALTMSAPLNASIAEGLASIHSANRQMASLAVRGGVQRSGTHWQASYGLQNDNVMAPLTAFDLTGPAPYLNFIIRQPVRFGFLGTNNLEALIDVRNLLAQGYRPMLSPDGETIFLVEAPRTVLGGLRFSF